MIARRDRPRAGASGSRASAARPLYKDAAKATWSTTTAGNAGLWYDKFCDRWKPDWTGFAGDSGKRDWIAQIANVGAGSTPKTVGDSALINEAAARLDALVKARDGSSFRRTTAWRFVTGLGRSHPIENGFAWHQTLGTPYLAGPGLKGLARAYARDWDCVPEKSVLRIFGPKPEAGLPLGSVVFLDALPIAPIVLEADVMTPHYARWYQDGAVPGDWHSPTPIPFLAVATGQTFLFAMLPQNPSKPEDREDCACAARLLSEALDVLGAGAKTATGYGQFVAQQRSETAAETRAARAVAPGPHADSPESWTGRKAIVHRELVQIIEDRGNRLRVRFPDGTEDVIDRSEARLR